MRAALLDHLPSDGFTVSEVRDPQPSQDELLIRVEACGICGTDIHILAGHSYKPALPFVLGHEPVGVVDAVGADDMKDWLGRRITMTIFEGCRECEFCKEGAERLCINPRTAVGALNRWGGFAEMMTIPAAQALEVPERLGSVQAATLVDAGVTASNALSKLTKPFGYAVVVGAGPVGFFVAGLLRHAGVEPAVVETNPARASEMTNLTYHVVRDANSLDDQPDVVLDCTGVSEVLPWALNALRPGGLFVVVGYSVIPQLEMALVSRKELTIRGVRSGSRQDLVQIMGLASNGSIALPDTRTWRLADINDAIVELRAGSVAGKAVVVPQSR